jgi:hypothetical protein
LDEAASLLKRSLRSTRALVDEDRLPLVPGTKSMVYPADVAAIAAADSLPPIRQPVGPPGYLNTRQAAERLGLSGPYVAQMAAVGKLPAEFQDGQWWFDPERIEMVHRARQARRDRVVARPLRRSRKRPAP